MEANFYAHPALSTHPTKQKNPTFNFDWIVKYSLSLCFSLEFSRSFLSGKMCTSLMALVALNGYLHCYLSNCNEVAMISKRYFYFCQQDLLIIKAHICRTTHISLLPSRFTQRHNMKHLVNALFPVFFKIAETK